MDRDGGGLAVVSLEQGGNIPTFGLQQIRVYFFFYFYSQFRALYLCYISYRISSRPVTEIVLP